MATLIFSANELPPSTDNSHGYRRRWIIIPFTLTLNKNDAIPNYVSTLTTSEELSGLLNVALAALRRLEAQKGFSENASTAAAHDEYAMDSNNVMRFIQTECVVSPEAFAVKKELFKVYKEWCEESGYDAVNMHKFYQLALDIPGIVEGRDNDQRVFKGVSLDPTNSF